jgi:hypothetical protein
MAGASSFSVVAAGAMCDVRPESDATISCALPIIQHGMAQRIPLAGISTAIYFSKGFRPLLLGKAAKDRASRHISMNMMP